MNKLKILIFCTFLIITNSFGQAEGEYNSPYNCSNLNSFLYNENITQVESLVYEVFPNGGVMIDPEIMENGTTVEDIFGAMGVEENTSFQFVNETPSRLEENKFFRRYEQLFNSVKVNGGGYTEVLYRGTDTGPGGGPCDELAMISPYIIDEPNIPTTPNILESDILDILPSPVVRAESELLISHNLDNECEFILTWKVIYFDGVSSKVSWIDAQNGEIIKTKDATVNLFAPMENVDAYGAEQDLDDRFDAATGKTFLESSDDSDFNIKILDIPPSGPCLTNPLDEDLWDDSFVPSTSNPEFWEDEATPITYQTFFLASTVLPLFKDELGIEFNNVNIAVDENSDTDCLNSEAILDPTLDNAFIRMGLFGPPGDLQHMSVIDMLSHELAHCYLFRHIEYDFDKMGPKSIHEGIADIIGEYIE